MGLSVWLRNSWVTAHQSSAREIQDLLALADRDLHECRITGLSADWRFNIAYNAALQSATAALAAAGYRAAREAHHYRVIHSLQFTIGADPTLIRRFDAFRKKRNLTSYEMGGIISDLEAKEMTAFAGQLRRRVEQWMRSAHPQFLSPKQNP